MKDSILAQTVAQEFISRFPMVTSSFDEEAFKLAIFDFLRKGEDDDDRVAAVRLSLSRANRRSSIESIMDNAQEILSWPPKPPEPTPIKPVVKKAAPKARGRRKSLH